MNLRAMAVVFALGACGGTNGGAGEGSGDDDPGVDASIEPVGCTDDTQCSSDLPICADAGYCVQCETSADCSADKPVCGGGTCQASCAGDAVAADFVTKPSDIIFVVDQSGSMDQETAYVQAKINEFAALIGNANIDYRVTMIASTAGNNQGNNKICVPSPLSNGSCGNNTNFRLVSQYVNSNDGPSRFIGRYSAYSDFLRMDAQKHIIFITDDNSNMSATNFTNGVAALMPTGMFANYKVHAIYAYGNGQNSGCTGAFGSGAAVGNVYTTLVANTGGSRGVICNNDWTTVFNDITTAIVTGSQVACELNVPSPANGTLDPTQVNVKYQSGGQPPGVTLPQVPSSADCTAGGWYYDVPSAPTKIHLCPSTCTEVQGDDQANLSIELGCSTQIF